MENNKNTLYNKVYNDLIKKIKNGEYKVGEKIPTEMELTKIYGVSRITIAKAMKNLADINLVYRIKKSGTFVNGKLTNSTPLIIPVILPFEEDFNEIVDGIYKTASTHNIFIRFYNSKNNITKERKILKEILSSNFDGLIIYPCSSTFNIDLYVEILSRKIPIVCVDRNILGISTPVVTTDNVNGMCNVVNHLVKSGHKKIGFFSVSDQMESTEINRFNGFCKGLIDNKIKLRKEYVFDLSDLHKSEITLSLEQQNLLLREYIKTELKRYLSLQDKPTAICCVNDSILESVYSVAKELNINAPNDVFLTGFDCVDIKKVCGYNAVSVRQNFSEIGRRAMQTMLSILDGKQYKMLELVDSVLVNSTNNI